MPKVVFEDAKSELELLQVLSPSTDDSVDVVRRKSYYATNRIGAKSQKLNVRQFAVAQLVKGIGDSNSGISGYSSRVLVNYEKEDFTEKVTKALVNYIGIETPYLDQVALLAGYLEIPESKVALNKVISAKTSFSNRWAASLAMARMGDNQSINYVKNKMSKAPLNDELVYEVVPDLVYTREKEIYRFLEEIMQSDEKGCSSPDPDSNRKILCGYRVMEALAPVILEFPVVVDEFGDVIIKGYPKALDEVNTWFKANPDYIINRAEY